MEFANIKKRVASNIGYIDSSGDILSSKDITETDIGNWVNDRYIDDLFSLISGQYSEDFRQVGKLNFYKGTGTVSTSSDESTLVATGNIFNNGMVGDTVYSSTSDESAVITGYTSATTVTLDTEIDDTWDGDTIYILGTEFGLGGDAIDVRDIQSVSVKYSADDTKYTTCEKSSRRELFKNGDETFHTVKPYWYPTTVDIDGVLTTAIGIVPEATENVSDGISLEYTEQPGIMEDDTDVPRLPLGSHTLLVLGATADALRKLMRLDEADRYEQKFQAGKMEMVATYALTRSAGVPRTRPSASRLRNMVEREL